MIVQACLNGARPADFHPRLPTTAEAMAREGAACLAAGAAELHLHPRGADGRESLGAVDETVAALRGACPGTAIGVSTGSWIEGGAEATLAAIDRWRDLPDYASVNLSEPEAPEVMDALRAKDVGIEAGLSSIADAERFLGLDGRRRVLRILIELDEPDAAAARTTALEIAARLGRAGTGRPILLHGVDGTVWPLVGLARRQGWSTRVGLEDGRDLPDGRPAPDNAALVAAAVALYRTWEPDGRTGPVVPIG